MTETWETTGISSGLFKPYGIGFIKQTKAYGWIIVTLHMDICHISAQPRLDWTMLHLEKGKKIKIYCLIMIFFYKTKFYGAILSK